MKKLITLFCFLGLSASAQPSYTTIAVPPNNTAVSSRSTTYTGTLPLSGANQTWDFSSLSFTNPAATNIAYTNVNASPRASSFPNATYYEVSQNGDEVFYQITSTKSNLLGNYNNANNLTIVNSDVQTVLSVPFNYGDTQSDTYGASYVANSIPATKTGSMQVNYNSYGTLTTPDGTYTNIPMLVSTTDETHTFEFSPGVSFSQRFVSTSYSWGYPGDYTFKFAIVKVDIYADGSLSGTVTNALKIENVPTGLFNSSHVASAAVFPQPAKDKVSISANELDGSCKATIYNINNEIVLTHEGYAVDHSLALGIESLPQGLYIVELNNNEKMFRSKLIIQ
jgi:Secretion system C-terminal sorting domain